MQIILFPDTHPSGRQFCFETRLKQNLSFSTRYPVGFCIQGHFNPLASLLSAGVRKEKQSESVGRLYTFLYQHASLPCNWEPLRNSSALFKGCGTTDISLGALDFFTLSPLKVIPQPIALRIPTVNNFRVISARK